MKILSLEESEIDLGEYGPACEGFIDAVKSIFLKSDPQKRINEINKARYPNSGYIAKDLAKDLKLTYENPTWVEKNLSKEKGMIQVKLLGMANVNQKQITKPEEILKVAKEMFAVVNQIYEREKPFIQLRCKLIEKFKDEKDIDKIDAMWQQYKSQLMVTAVDRYRQTNKKPISALALAPGKRVSGWPVNLTDLKDQGFVNYPEHKTDGTFEAPNQSNAHEFAKVITELTDMAIQLDWLAQQASVPYWEIMEFDYNAYADADDVYSYLCSSQGNYEISDLAWDVEFTLGQIVCGLYIAMFDKHLVAKPANEGWVDRVKNVFTGKKAVEPVKYDGRRALAKVQDFLANPDNYTLSGTSFKTKDGLYLSLNGRAPLLAQMPSALEHTIKDAMSLDKTLVADMKSQLRICKPLIEQFERTCINAMDKEGNIDQAILDKAVEPLIAAVPKVKASYYNTFVTQDSLKCASWLGGNPFKYQTREYNGHEYFEDAERDGPIDVSAATNIDALKKLAEVLIKYSDASYPCWAEGMFEEAEDYWISYEFDRPVRHLDEYMNEVQFNAIHTVYSHESNSQSVQMSLSSEMMRLHSSLLHYFDATLVKK